MYDHTNSSQDNAPQYASYEPGPSNWYKFPSESDTAGMGPTGWNFAPDATGADNEPTGLFSYDPGTITEETARPSTPDSMTYGFAAPPSPSTPVSPTSGAAPGSQHSFEGGRSRPGSSGGRKSSSASPTRARRNSSSSVSSSPGGSRGGRKMHACPYQGCGRAFIRPSALVGHIRIHTKEEPFVCPVAECARPFNVYSNLVRHMKTHPEVDFDGVFVRDYPTYRLHYNSHSSG